MGSANSAEFFDLVSTYILSEIVDQFPFGGLYHCDGLLYLQNIFDRKLQSVKINLVNFFFNMDLSITFDEDRTKVNFLDLTRNLITVLPKL